MAQRARPRRQHITVSVVGIGRKVGATARVALAIALTKESDLVAVVDFTAEWCGPCQAIKPFYTELAAKHKDAALFLKVDVDEMDDIAQEAGVAAMPTFQVYKEGSKVDTVTGASEGKLEAMVTADEGRSSCPSAPAPFDAS